MKSFTYPKPEQWQPKTRTDYVQIPAGITVGEMAKWCEDNGVPLTATLSANCHFVVVRPETDEEFTKRVYYMIDAEERHREFIKGRYAAIMEAEAEALACPAWIDNAEEGEKS